MTGTAVRRTSDGGRSAPPASGIASEASLRVSTLRGAMRLVAPPWLVLGFFLLLHAAAALAAAPYVLSGRVVHVADGDTLTLQAAGGQRRVRLASIDAPEIGHGRERPGQPYGQTSRRALAGLVAGRVLDLNCYEQDQYGRDVCDVPLGGGRTANQMQVEAGMAWANRQGGGKYLRDTRLLALERLAREGRLGLWQRADAVPPWEWRWKCWEALESRRATPICQP